MVYISTLEKILTYSGKHNSSKKTIENLDSPYEFLLSLFIYLDTYTWLKNYDGIKKALDTIEVFLKIHDDDYFIFRTFLKKIQVFQSIGNLPKSFDACREMLRFSKKTGKNLYISESFMKNGSFWEIAEKASKLPSKITQAIGKKQDGCLGKALYYFSLAENIYKTDGVNYNHTVSIFNKAYIYFYLDMLDLAYSNCLKAIELGEILNSDQILSNAFLLLANIYDSKKNFLMSKIYYEKAFECFKHTGAVLKASDIMHKLAWILAQEKKYKRAIREYESALALKVSIDYKQALGEFFFQRAMIMKSLGDSKTATKLFDRALFVYNILRDNNRAQFIKFNLFKINVKQSSLYSFIEFMSNYRPPVSNEILKASITTDYALRSGESAGLKPHLIPQNSFDINRKTLSNMFGEMSRICSISGDENKYKQYALQLKAVKTKINF